MQMGPEVPCRAPPSNKKKITLEKKILSNAYETIVANDNHNYMLDPMNKVH